MAAFRLKSVSEGNGCTERMSVEGRGQMVHFALFIIIVR